MDYKRRAVSLSYDDPLQYYPGTTFADVSPRAATNLSNLGLASGEGLAQAVPISQRNALASNDAIARGGAFETANPQLTNLFDLSHLNPSTAGMNALSPVATGQYFQGAQPYIRGLADLGGGEAA